METLLRISILLKVGKFQEALNLLDTLSPQEKQGLKEVIGKVKLQIEQDSETVRFNLELNAYTNPPRYPWEEGEEQYPDA